MRTVGISVLMSVYARECPAFLDRALGSLESQTSPANEVVLVCDGPLGPELDRVIGEFSGRLPLVVIQLDKNCGLPAALNAGLQHCREDWIARFDSDDVCEPQRFEVQRDYIRKHPDIDVFGSSIAEFDTDENTPYAVRSVVLSHEAIRKFARIRSPLNHMTVVFRRSVVLGIGGYPTDYLYEDYSLWVRLLQAGHRFGNIEQPLVRARAGRSMADRRGGIAYLQAEINAQARFWRSGFIGTGQFIFNVCVRSAVRVAPPGFRAMLYRRWLRTARG